MDRIKTEKTRVGVGSQQGDLISILTKIRWAYTDRQQGDLISVLTTNCVGIYRQAAG
jgi:hypothetical protein